MVEYCGKTFFSSCDVVTGRLWAMGKDGRDTSDVAKILVWTTEGDMSDPLLRSAVGIVFPMEVSDEELKRASRSAEFRKLPAIRLSCSCNSILADLNQPIAILDSGHQRLYVDPDLETINCFFGTRCRRSQREISILSEYSPSHSADGCDGLVVSGGISKDMGEDEMYEYLCDIADKNTGMSIVATADLRDGAAEQTDRFVSRIRATYRAGVWGRFSLLCTSVHTPNDANTCIALMHKAFCQLDSESREFNGFIPKGIAISTPLMLLSRPKHRMIDFFCIDYPRLRQLMTDTQSTDTGAAETAKYISAFIREASSARIALRSKGTLTNNIIDSMGGGDVISEIYALPSEISRLRGITS